MAMKHQQLKICDEFSGGGTGVVCCGDSVIVDSSGFLTTQHFVQNIKFINVPRPSKARKHSAQMHASQTQETFLRFP